jgi:hypothetical protein
LQVIAAAVDLSSGSFLFKAHRAQSKLIGTDWLLQSFTTAGHMDYFHLISADI